MPAANDYDELRSLPGGHGVYTQSILSALEEVKPVPTNTALMELVSEIVPFNERLTEYISLRFDIPDEVKAIKKRLRDEGQHKGLSFSSANLSQWITSDKWEVFISPKSLFKLCLAMGLDIPESKRFAYECLHRTWLNYRVPEEAVYIIILGLQDLFAEDSFSVAEDLVAWLSHGGIACDMGTGHVQSAQGATGYTMLLGNGIRNLADRDFSSRVLAIESIRDYLVEYSAAFTGVQRSAISTYNTYFSKGGVGIRPLVDLYRDQTGLALPENSYLDNAYVQEDATRKRLLWGTINRSEWLSKNDRDLDILNEREIRTEEHAVGRMQSAGVPRGNVIALLFFHFCFERRRDFKLGYDRKSLFSEFYEMTNYTLVDECGMMPLHPRKQLDALFMRSIANSGKMDPIDYLNQLLEDFYAM